MSAECGGVCGQARHPTERTHRARAWCLLKQISRKTTVTASDPRTDKVLADHARGGGETSLPVCRSHGARPHSPHQHDVLAGARYDGLASNLAPRVSRWRTARSGWPSTRSYVEGMRCCSVRRRCGVSRPPARFHARRGLQRVTRPPLARTVRADSALRGEDAPGSAWSAGAHRACRAPAAHRRSRRATYDGASLAPRAMRGMPADGGER